MKRILAILVGLILSSGAYSQDFKKEVVHFETDKAELRKHEKERIDAFLQTLGDLNKVRFGIYGHTDSRGSLDYNLDLSERRTESVMDYLMYKGVDASNVIPDHFGEVKPVDENSNDNGMANNRRVEIRAFAITPEPEKLLSELEPPANPYGFKDHKLVKPILPKLAKERQVFTVNANEPIFLKIESGTRVWIPANSLVDARGEVIQGDVNISYREYHEPIDVLLSGIPMTFDSAGAGYQFQTAGMFELQAAQRGREVFLKEGENIRVYLQSMDAETDYNLYALDENQGWQNINTAPPAPQIDWTNAGYPSKAYDYYINYNKTGSYLLDEMEQCAFNELFDDPEYFYTHKTDEASNFLTTYHFTTGRRMAKVTKYGLLKVRTVRREREDPKDLIRFTVQQLTSRSHPELSAMRGQVWILKEPMDRVDFRKAFSFKKKYSDIRVEISDDGDYVILNLKENGSVNQLKVTPAVPGIEDPAVAMESFKDQYERYEKQLAKREKRHEKMRNKANKNLLKDYAKMRTKYNKQLEDLKTDFEKPMDFDEWVAYNEDLMAQYRERMGKVAASSYTLTRSLALEGFGIFNCDQIYRLKDPMKVVAKYQAPKEMPVDWQTAYVLDSELRGVLTYPRDGYADVSAGMVALDPKTVQAMVVVDINGQLSYLKKEGIVSSMNESRRRPTFEVTEVAEVTSVSELKEMLGLAH